MQNTKDKILQAGQRKFSQQGYEKTSMRDIADQVGVSKANIYHHFSSKQELLGKIIESAFETYKKEIRQIVSEHQQAEKQLRSAIISYFEYCEENQDLVRLLTREDIKQNEQIRSLITDIESKVRAVWKQLLENIEIEDDYDLDTITDLFMNMVDSVVIKKFVIDCKEVESDKDKLADHILYLLIKQES